MHVHLIHSIVNDKVLHVHPPDAPRPPRFSFNKDVAVGHLLQGADFLAHMLNTVSGYTRREQDISDIVPDSIRFDIASGVIMTS